MSRLVICLGGTGAVPVSGGLMMVYGCIGGAIVIEGNQYVKRYFVEVAFSLMNLFGGRAFQVFIAFQ